MEQTPEDFWDWKCSVCAKADETEEAQQPTLELRNVNENSIGYESDSNIVVSAPVSNLTLNMHREREVSPEPAEELSNDSRLEENEDDENKSQNAVSEKSNNENKSSKVVESIDLTNSDIEVDVAEPLSERQNNETKVWCLSILINLHQHWPKLPHTRMCMTSLSMRS